MTKSLEIFRNKRIAVIGLSIEGVSTINYLIKKKIPFTAFDQREKNNFSADFINHLENNKIKYYFGNGYLSSLSDFDYIIRTPGFPLWDENLLKAEKAEITSQIKLFFDLFPGTIIGVTGTKGKGTTSTLIYKMLNSSRKKVFLGGNIGTPPFDFLDISDKDSIAVLELSSFQLEDLNKSPHISVVLNITSDHLFSVSKESPNYHRTQKDYLNAKLNILKFQTISDYCVLNKDYDSVNNLGKETKADIYFFSIRKKINKGSYIQNNQIFFADGQKEQTICQTAEVKLRGRHNLENITAASTATLLAGGDLDAVSTQIKTFAGLEHRLEPCGEKNGVLFFNDSFSTTPDTAIAAIKSFSNPIFLICGGSEKKSDYTLLGNEIIKANIKKIYLIGQTGPRIKEAITKGVLQTNRKMPPIITGLNNFKEILTDIMKYATKGDVVLLSPASASFDMFKNYKERGKLFKEAVSEL